MYIISIRQTNDKRGVTVRSVIIAILFIFISSSIKAGEKFTWSGFGVLVEGPKRNKMVLQSTISGIEYRLTKSKNFHIGDTVFVSGTINRHQSHTKYPRIHVKEISWYDCCRSELKGDMNGDGVFHVGDLVLLGEIIKFNLSDVICIQNGDIDGDGQLSLTDLYYLRDYQFNYGPEPPPCE